MNVSAIVVLSLNFFNRWCRYHAIDVAVHSCVRNGISTAANFHNENTTKSIGQATVSSNHFHEFTHLFLWSAKVHAYLIDFAQRDATHKALYTRTHGYTLYPLTTGYTTTIAQYTAADVVLFISTILSFKFISLS